MAQILINTSDGTIGLSGGTYLGVIQDFQVSASTKGYYQFNNNLLDKSGNNYNGASGATTGYKAPGILFPSALKISGVTSQVKMSNQVIPSGMKQVGFWYYNLGGNLTYSSIISNNDIFSDSNGVSFYWGDNTLLIGQQRKIGSGNKDFAQYLPLNTWTHYLWQWDGTTNVNGMKLYLNGIIANQDTCGFTAEGAATFNMRVGANAATGIDGNATYNTSYGYMQDLIIENRCWSAAEVLSYNLKYRPI